MGLSLIEPSAALPVSLDELKLHCRIDTEDFDEDLTIQLNAAVRHVEEITRRALMTQQWQLTLPRFPIGTRAITLPKGALQGVDEVSYVDSAGEIQTLAEEIDFLVASRREPALIVPVFGSVWPAAREFLDSVTVTFTCGFGDDSADVPADLRHAILLFAGWAFQGVESDLSLGGTETARDRAFRALVGKWVLHSDEVAEAIEA